MKILNRFGKSLSKSQVLILGVAYKQDINDYRESPAVEVIKELEKLHANIKYYDPHISSFKEDGVLREGEKSLTKELLMESDLVIITTAHTVVDYNFVQKIQNSYLIPKMQWKNIMERENIELLWWIKNAKMFTFKFLKDLYKEIKQNNYELSFFNSIF